MSAREISTERSQATQRTGGARLARPAADTGDPGRRQRRGGDDATSGITGLRVAAALISTLLGLVLVAQVQATEGLGDRLATEREEDLARILSDLSAESDRLQGEITELRLTLIEFESSAEQEELALRSLRRRLDDLRVLTGVVATEGPGITLIIEDPVGRIAQELLVDTIQELRDAGAEAIAVNGVRLVASSWFGMPNGRLVLDGQPLDSPYRVAAIGPAETMAKALDIPGGVVDNLTASPEVSASVEVLAQLEVPARGEPVPFIFGQPLPPEGASGNEA